MCIELQYLVVTEGWWPLHDMIPVVDCTVWHFSFICVSECHWRWICCASLHWWCFNRLPITCMEAAMRLWLRHLLAILQFLLSLAVATDACQLSCCCSGCLKALMPNTSQQHASQCQRWLHYYAIISVLWQLPRSSFRSGQSIFHCCWTTTLQQLTSPPTQFWTYLTGIPPATEDAAV